MTATLPDPNAMRERPGVPWERVTAERSAELGFDGEWYGFCLVSEIGEPWSLLSRSLMLVDFRLLVRGWPEAWEPGDVEAHPWPAS
jgi:hypothetical protein